MSNLSLDDLRHVARLARLGMDDDELSRIAVELDTIIDSIGKIADLDLSEVVPTTHALEVTNVLGADVAHSSLSAADALRNAPDTANGMFRVPRMQS